MNIVYLKDFGHLALLGEGAVVFNGQDDGHVGAEERGAVHSLHHILKDHGRQQQRKAVVYKM